MATRGFIGPSFVHRQRRPYGPFKQGVIRFSTGRERSKGAVAPESFPGGRLLTRLEANMSSISSSLGKIFAFAGLTLGLAACGGGGVTTKPINPPPPETYSLLQTLNPPNTLSFDISFVDETSHLYTLSDRSTNGIDVVNTNTDGF